MFLSTDKGENWKQISNGMQHMTPVVSIAIVGEVILAAQGGDFTDGEVYRSTDNGENWVRSHTGIIPRDGVKLLVNQLIVYKGEVYACIAGGEIFKSSDVGISWVKENENLSNASHLIIIDDYMFIGQIGVWKRPVK